MFAKLFGKKPDPKPEPETNDIPEPQAPVKPTLVPIPVFIPEEPVINKIENVVGRKREN
jgi:hypothetical protein